MHEKALHESIIIHGHVCAVAKLVELNYIEEIITADSSKIDTVQNECAAVSLQFIENW